MATPFIESMREAAATLRLPGSGLAWLDDARHEALRAFLEHGLPDARNELWKYTSLRALAQRAFAVGNPEAAGRPVPPGLLPRIAMDEPGIVFVDGAFRPDLSRLDGLDGGVTLQSLAQALRERPEPLRFLLASHAGDDDGFTLLNRALASDGVIVRLAAGARITRPLHIVHVALTGDAPVAWHLHSLLELAEGASLGIVEHFVGEPGARGLANQLCEVALRDKAHLDWTVIQANGADTTLLRRSDCRVGADAAIDFHALELGGKLARHELRVDLDGAHARFTSRGAFVLHDRQHVDSEILVTHRGRDATSNSVWRGVADGRARGVVHGRILVLPGADGADGGFYNKNLLLSPTAEIDTRPALEIYADEVKANHGATVGQLDENALFYLRSRGIPLDVARRMLVRAFCAVTLDGIQAPSLRDYCDTLLAAQLPEATP